VSSNSIQLDLNQDQFSESATKTLSMQWFSHIALSISESIYLVFLCQFSESATKTSRWESISSMSKSTSESASMTLFINAMTHSLSSFYFISKSNLSHVHFQLVSLLQWHNQNQSLRWASWFLHSESTTIDISMIWKINRKIDRKMSIKLYVSAMNYITSHRDMTFKEKKIMLWSMLTLNKV